MASGNFIGLVKIYSKDIQETLKGCEFHFKDSVNQKAKLFDELKEKLVTEALSLLATNTWEAYHAVWNQLKLFLNNELPSVDVSSWLDWSHDRRELILCIFNLKESPRSNLADVIHAGWKNWDRMHISLLDACFFDIRDNLPLESLLCGFQNGSFVVEYGPNQGVTE